MRYVDRGHGSHDEDADGEDYGDSGRDEARYVSDSDDGEICRV